MQSTPTPDLQATRGDVGLGVYGLVELREFLGVYGRPNDGDNALPWLQRALNPVNHRRHAADYSFSDLISLFVVRECRRRGVSLAELRRCEAYLRKKWKTDRPFVREEIQTDGVTLYVDDQPVQGQIESAGRRGQQVMREMIKDRLVRVHYSDGAAAYWTPLKGVLIDPRVQFGEPVVVGTRIPTETVGKVAHRIGAEDAAVELGLSGGQVGAALRFEERLKQVRV